MSAPAAAAPVAPLVARVAAGVPVLRATLNEIARLRAQAERVPAAALTAAILRDPLMTLQVLRFLYAHRTRSQNADITTVAHALMMLGQERFFREFDALRPLEDEVGEEALTALRARMIRARLAALFARDWAQQRHDIDPEEVMIAAALHDLPALLALLGAEPVAAAETPAARESILAGSGLPQLVVELNAQTPPNNPRAVNVELACRLARHCHDGWPQDAIAQALAELQRFLRTSEPQAWERVRRIALAAAREWRFYASPPAAACMPFIPPPKMGSDHV